MGGFNNIIQNLLDNGWKPSKNKKGNLYYIYLEKDNVRKKITKEEGKTISEEQIDKKEKS